MLGPSAGGMTRQEGGKSRINLPVALDSGRENEAAVATLSFPVCDGNPLRDNADIIAGIIKRRRPRLLLCAGGSLRAARNVDPVTLVTSQTPTQVVLEVGAERDNYLIESGRLHLLGKQFFASRKQTDEEPDRLAQLESALSNRSFEICSRSALLLICGEITLVQGRLRVHFHSAASENLRNAVQAERVLILNPTHTRMGNCGTINAWRSFLSQDGRVYMSSSNWNTCGDTRQRPTETIHTLWHDGKPRRAAYEGPESDDYCYREWELPA
jgi:hypothetical protein